MYSVENHVLTGGSVVENVASVEFSRSAFENLLKFKWQGYHTQSMVELEELGWVANRLEGGRTVGYVLTAAGCTSLWQDHCFALRGTKMLLAEDVAVPF
jgi:hypothetical protein